MPFLAAKPHCLQIFRYGTYIDCVFIYLVISLESSLLSTNKLHVSKVQIQTFRLSRKGKRKGAELSRSVGFGQVCKVFLYPFLPVLFFGSPAAESFEYLQRVSNAMLKLSFVYFCNVLARTGS